MTINSLASHWGARVAGILLASACFAQAAQQVAVEYSLPVQINGRVTSTDCNNSGGPQVTLDGQLKLGGLQTRLIFRNNQKGTHTAVVEWSTDVTLIPAGSSITIPKQPVRGGVGGNPHISLQFTDAKGNAVSEEIYLGRCVQGLQLSPGVELSSTVLSSIRTSECSNSGGPLITFDGNITLPGLRAKFIFRNNLKGTHTAQVTREVTLLPEGWTITIPKQPVRGGVGGNPLIWTQFLDENGDPLDEEVFLGRCNQI